MVTFRTADNEKKNMQACQYFVTPVKHEDLEIITYSTE